MIRASWLNACRKALSAAPSPRRSRSSRAASAWAADIRTLEPRTLLSAAVAERDVGTQDENFPPTITLDSTSESIDENSDTSSPTFMTGFLITSTNPGVLTTSLSGPDANFFEIDVFDRLNLKAGVVLDFESQNVYDVTVNVDDSLSPGNPDHSANFTLFLNDVNEAPQIANQTFTVLAGAPNGTEVGTIFAFDPDFDGLTFSAFFESNPGVFSVSSAGVITVANSAALTNGLSALLGVDVFDGELSNFADMTINVVSNTAPTIGGTAANQTVNDNATINPFSAVTVTDPDMQQMSATVTIENFTTRGDFTAASALNWSRIQPGNDVIYIRNFANVADLQTALRDLVFDPRENALTPGNPETTNFSLGVDDGFVTTSDLGTSVVTTSVNDATSLGGGVTNQPVNDNATIAPFSAVTITDPDFQQQTASVTIADGANRGDFTVVSANGWNRSTSGNNITYTQAFPAAANTAANVQTALRALVFDPRENAIAPGTTESTSFVWSVTNDFESAAGPSSVITTSVNDPLTISGTAANQPVNDNATISPFNLVTVSDPDTQALTANVTILNGVNRGDFTPGSAVGWTCTTPVGGNIVYARTFPAAANNGAVVQAAIQALVFDPRENALKPNTTETTPFTITIFGGGPAPTANSTTSVVTTSVNNVPSFSGIQNRSVNDDTDVNPFNDLEINDPDFQEGLAKVTILNGVVRGDFINAVQTGWTRTVLGNNIQYLRYFNPSADVGSTVMNAYRGLAFQPRQNAIKPGTTELTDFQVIFSDGVAQPIVNAATRVTTVSVNNAPTITGAVPNLPVFDNATATPFVAEATSLTITDPDNQDMFATVVIQNGVVRGDFTPASRAGWTRAVVGNDIRYTRYFAQAANIGNVVQTAVRALVFQPRVNVLTPGTTETTIFAVTVKDGSNATATNSVTSVVTTSANDAPVIGGTVTGQTMNDNQTKLVFNTVTITDLDRDDMNVTVTISNGNVRGDFTVASRAGWTRTLVGNDIRYTRYFNTATNIGSVVQTAIRALVFQPRTNVPIGTTETTGFTIFVNDGFANATNNSTTVITTGVAPRPAAIELAETDITTVILSTLKRPEANPLSSLLKRKR